ncbi:hypothetical protein FOZ63_030846 [Perkinsus olseni]|uniref:Uncharacterized protein n=1 Tax=Perkinsus olseni TaxID=32597 RepID=A0A7J6UJW8_PEROL|nr:hypothetical protein FOZ62_000741 [Perkinsus olseni]KAF4757493.1 hypothetical protein FOZ63_030846 [Perkinsus olseni]
MSIPLISLALVLLASLGNAQLAKYRYSESNFDLDYVMEFRLQIAQATIKVTCTVADGGPVTRTMAQDFLFEKVIGDPGQFGTFRAVRPADFRKSLFVKHDISDFTDEVSRLCNKNLQPVDFDDILVVDFRGNPGELITTVEGDYKILNEVVS